MKKITIVKLLLVAAIMVSGIQLKAQVAINDNGNPPDGSAMLDVSSTSLGVILPSMTQAQRDAISSPASGLLIFQTDNNPGFYYNKGTSTSIEWVAITLSGPQASASSSGYITSSDYDYFSSNTSPWYYGENSTIYYDFNVGVGLTSDPTYRLHVINSTWASNGGSDGGFVALFRNNGSRTDANGLRIQCSTATGSTQTKLMGFYTSNGTSLGSVVWNGVSGAGASPAFATASDLRLKDVISGAKSSVDLLMNVNVVDFKWKDDPKGKIYTGFIAQDLFNVFPNAVIKPEDENVENWKIMKEELIPIMVKSIQDQQMIIKSQEEKIKSLEERLSAVEKLLAK